MSMRRICKDDTVIVLAGREKGKTGTVVKIDSDKVIVKGLNMLTHYIKRDQQKGVEGALKKVEAPIHISNLAYYDEKDKKPVKIGFKVLPEGKKIRYNKRTKKEVGK